MNNETSYFLFQSISFKKYFYVSLGNNFLLFCEGPPVVKAMPSLTSLKSGPAPKCHCTRLRWGAYDAPHPLVGNSNFRCLDYRDLHSSAFSAHVT